MSSTESDELQLKLDEEAARQGYFLVSSIRRPSYPGFFTEEVLGGIAQQALEEMRQKWKTLVDSLTNMGESSAALKFTMRKRAPTAVCVLFAADKLFICSSVRRLNGKSFINLISPDDIDRQLIIQALKLADLYDDEEGENSEPEIGHDHQANCAELLALHLWSVSNTERLEHPDRFSLVTVRQQAGETGVFAPCTPNGCAEVLRTLNIDPPSRKLLAIQSPVRKLFLQPAPQHSITETQPGYLHLYCGGRCGGTRWEVRGRVECQCTMFPAYSAWYRNRNDIPSWASMLNDPL